ncbi:MAP kinase-activated protein kinase 2 (Fragment) [Seminavis robusta]|uniref:MAP kinase-activated protein kinase 2 n=1 Tax=Seminavis robusta TaxID=568900 RepID=A0A9N8HJJ1_9STRA
MMKLLTKRGGQGKQRIYPSKKMNLESLNFLDETNGTFTDVDAFLSTATDDDDGLSYYSKNSKSSVENQIEGAHEDNPELTPSYVLHRHSVLGRGSFGQVCVASRCQQNAPSKQGAFKLFNLRQSGHEDDKTHGTTLACKCLVLPSETKKLAKLLKEVKIMRQVQGHENVIQLHDVYIDNQELLVITELGTGGTLLNLLKNKKVHKVKEFYAGKTRFLRDNHAAAAAAAAAASRISTSASRTWTASAKTIAELLSAIAFLHSRGIVHREYVRRNRVRLNHSIHLLALLWFETFSLTKLNFLFAGYTSVKLENVVLSRKDVWSPLKLIDFGLATPIAKGQRLTRVVGSYHYIAPECFQKSYTEACDSWSLGVVLFALLAGGVPFHGKDQGAIKHAVLRGSYNLRSPSFDDVSREAKHLIMRLLCYNAQTRSTANQALSHPWLKSNCDPRALQRALQSADGQAPGKSQEQDWSQAVYATYSRKVFVPVR